MVHFFPTYSGAACSGQCRAAVVPQQMQLLGFESWSWCWIPGRVHVEVTNPSPPRFGCVQHFMLVGRQPGNKAELWGKQWANHRQPIPWSPRARVKMASLILAKEKEMQNSFQFFKPFEGLLTRDTGLCKLHAALWDSSPLDLPTFLQEDGDDEKYLMQWIHT